MSKAKQVIKWINDWANLIGLIIAVIALIYTILPYYNDSAKVSNFDGSVKVTNFQEANLCNGYLVNDAGTRTSQEQARAGFVGMLSVV
jgi:hypothetical protein